MALKFADLAKPETLLVSLAIVAGSYVVLPFLGAILRPLAKTVIKGGLATTDWVSETTAGMREQMEDMVAEARSETAGPSHRSPAHSKKADVKPEPTATTS
jgi:uncharacterized protein DUF5132